MAIKATKPMIALWTLIRIYVGWQWFSSGIEKTFGPSSDLWVGSKAGTAVYGFLQGALQKTSGTHPDVQWWYAEFLRTFAIPNAKLFSYTVAFGELLVGVSLILGLLTTIGLFCGVLMNMNYLFSGAVSINPLLLLLEAILLWAGPAAYYWGIVRFWNPLKRCRAGTS